MLFWIVIGTLAFLVLLVGVGRLLLRLRSEPALRGLPTTPIQRLAWIGVAISIAVGVGLAVLTAVEGVSGLNENPALTILVMGGVGVWLLPGTSPTGAAEVPSWMKGTAPSWPDP